MHRHVVLSGAPAAFAALTCGLMGAAGCGGEIAMDPPEDGPDGGGSDASESGADAPGEAAASLCTGVIPRVYYTGSFGDARIIKSETCDSTDPASDVEVVLEQTGFRSALFVATVTQTKPTVLSESFCAIPSWSGHFFNFNDPSAGGVSHTDGGAGTTVFHLRARGLGPPGGDYPGDDNLQVHWSWSTNTGQINVQDGDIHCVAQFN
jgi:hypothetical protein